jgi:hypothetical protein
MRVATSTGPQKCELTQPKMDTAKSRPADKYDHKLAPQPVKLKLPAGKQNDSNYPQESIN